jgi:exodeoxyribonuclease VII small subunit
MTNPAEKNPSLEEAFGEIAKIIEQMEHAPLTLEQSLTQFERGVTLIKHCQKILNEAEQKVQILLQTNQQDILTPYETDTNEGQANDEDKNT